MASKLDMPAPPPFKVIGENTNLAKSWELYLKRFDYYISASGVTKDEQKKAMLLHLAGEEVQDIFETFEGNYQEQNYMQVKEKLTEYFNPQKNIAYERHAFRSCKQEKEENMDNYIIRLKKMAVSCDYAQDTVSDMIRDQIVDSCQSNELRKKFLKEKNLTLTKIQEISRASELADLHCNKIDQQRKNPQGASAQEREYYAYKVEKNKPRKKQYHPRTQPRAARRPKLICFRCGYEGHSGFRCLRSRNVVCSVCHKKNHFGHMCRSKVKQKVNFVDESENSESYMYDGNISDNEEITSVGHVFHVSNCDSNSVEILIEGKSVKVLIDSGASVNCMDKNTFNSVKTQFTKVEKSNAKIYPYASKIPLKLLGVSSLNVNVNGKSHKLIFHIIDGQCKPIIGLKCAVDLGMLKLCVNSMEDQKSNQGNVDSIQHEFKDRFKGLGKLKDFQLKLHIDRSVQPIAQPARKMPFKMREQVKHKLDELLRQDIIEKVEGPTSWLSPLVVVPKPNNDIRICVDMRQANTAVQRERFPLPNIDETLEEMNGAKIFSKLDLRQGFCQIEIEPSSRDITNFVTYDGIYRFRRLNFGISCAPEIYQRIIQQTLQDIQGCKNISDDIIIFAKTQTEHDQILRKVLQGLRDKNLTLNAEKCVFSTKSLSFMGHILTSEGLKPQDSKIQAVLQTERPKNVKEIKSYLGLVSYCSKFVPNFATISEPLRKLTRKHEDFRWETEQENAFKALKEALVSAEVMSYYDPNAETRLIVDASPVGLGAIFEQKQNGNFRPVAYASRTLNAVERRYSQIERESLGVTWSIERFYVYLYGINFTVLTDHKPLISIFKPTHEPPARIQKWILRLQPYTFTVEFLPGSLNASDVLSRSPIKDNESDYLSEEAEQYINFVAEHTVPKAMTLDEIE